MLLVGNDDPLVPLSNALLMAARIPLARVHVVPGEGHFMRLDDRGGMPGVFGEFLGADALEDSEVWQSARTVTEAEADRQVRADGLGALPGGAVSAMVRKTGDH